MWTNMENSTVLEKIDVNRYIKMIYKRMCKLLMGRECKKEVWLPKVY